MKLAYERPVMRAEAFRTNAYCFGCDTNNDGSATGMNNLKVGDAGSWWSIPSSWNWNWGSEISKNNTNYSQYSNLTFGGTQTSMKGTNNADQFYWTTTGADGKVYHLEYSDGWSTHMGNNQKADGEYAFVLYEEDRSATDGKLDAAVNAGDMWPGADEDGDNEGNWSNRYKFDNAIMALIFKTVDTYWS